MATQPIRLRNTHCAYCGVLLNRSNSSRDHLVGRNFVPANSLVGEWNLILGACKSCNVEKSDLEDDISAITLLPIARATLADGVLPDHGDRAAQKAARSISRVTRRPVQESAEQFKLSTSRFGVNVDFQFIGDPRISLDRSARLAWMHLRGCILFLSHDEHSNATVQWPADMLLISEVARSDWGNLSQVSFAKHVSHWEPRLVVTTASGYFRIAIRRDPTAYCWSWAFEWNKNRRLVGFFGDPEPVSAAMKRIPQSERMIVERNSQSALRMFQDTPLSNDDDILFNP